jgi:hypothetical protein
VPKSRRRDWYRETFKQARQILDSREQDAFLFRKYSEHADELQSRGMTKRAANARERAMWWRRQVESYDESQRELQERKTTADQVEKTADQVATWLINRYKLTVPITPEPLVETMALTSVITTFELWSEDAHVFDLIDNTEDGDGYTLLHTAHVISQLSACALLAIELCGIRCQYRHAVAYAVSFRLLGAKPDGVWEVLEGSDEARTPARGALRLVPPCNDNAEAEQRGA